MCTSSVRKIYHGIPSLRVPRVHRAQHRVRPWSQDSAPLTHVPVDGPSFSAGGPLGTGYVVAVKARDHRDTGSRRARPLVAGVAGSVPDQRRG
jgi:hypothetical protein